MKAAGKPLIGILMDEDTSRTGRVYETGKGYFEAVARAGGVAIGLPYHPDSVTLARDLCAGVVSTGARVRFPDAFYVAGERSAAPASDRFEVDLALVRQCLATDQPFLGICNGMQLLACVRGSRMTGNLRARNPQALVHDGPEAAHDVAIEPGTRLAAICGGDVLAVNSLHREAVVDPVDGVVVSARAPDGVIEAVEVPDHRFALGVQWHPERLAGSDARHQALFDAFVAACGAAPGVARES